MELGTGEIVLILIVALLMYGGRLPEVARALGKSFGELKRGLTETKETVTRDLDVKIDVDADDGERRETQRMQPAPEELAKEDVSGTPTAHSAPPAKPQDDVRTRHEHPN